VGISSRTPSQQSLKSGVKVLGQLCVIGVTRSRQRSYDYQATGRKKCQSFSHEMTQPALDLVPHDRGADGLAHDETRTRRGNGFPGRMRVRDTAAEVDDEEWASGPASSAYRGREVLAPPQPMLGRQHDVIGLKVVTTQADRRARPLLRRDARIARPARVRIRSRKPWVFARRRLFGWKVRLLTRGLQK
jgi:hypothetical protein